MASGRQITSRSSLFSHRFPTFYACYLLKSIQTPLSKATYIGSTPSPPRRIRQHNGELTQGASKTKHKRPWVMQMIVHGFPSRLAALQFEWAWQHPYKSRHLRDPGGKALVDGSRKSRNVKANVQIVQMMLSCHPYNNWPLHVKLFTDEAVKAWNDAAKSPSASKLPTGLTLTVEIEGVDGKSGQMGSGRRGPIDVTDEKFTSIYLAKNTSLLASTSELHCSVCQENLTSYATEHLTTTLCPTHNCNAVSHLSCLSKHFLTQDTTHTTIIPRGGRCTSCHTYILWGDIIRGCYRRLTTGAVDPEDEGLSDDQSAMYDSDIPASPPISKQPAGVTAKTSESSQKGKGPLEQSSEGEFFDMNVSSSEKSDTPRKRGRPRKVSPVPMLKAARIVRVNTPTTSRPRDRPLAQKAVVAPSGLSSEGELFDSDSSSSVKSDISRKRGRPREPYPTGIVASIPPLVSDRRRGRPATVTTVLSRPYSSSKGEHVDFDAIVDSDDNSVKQFSPISREGVTLHKDSKERDGHLKPYRLGMLNVTLEVPNDPLETMMQAMSSMSLTPQIPKKSRKPAVRYIEISD